MHFSHIQGSRHLGVNLKDYIYDLEIETPVTISHYTGDGRRYADKKFGYVHACSTYPLSDTEIQIIID